MGIASWKGRNRRHKDAPVKMRIEDVTSSVFDYARRFLKEPGSEMDLNAAIQNTLGMHFGKENYYKEVRAYLQQLTKENVESEESLQELFTKVEKVSKGLAND